jgi:SAM-dependent methyltransferase
MNNKIGGIFMGTQPELPQEPPPPEILLNLLFGNVTYAFIKLPILRAAIELQIWAKVAEGAQTEKELAFATGTDMGGIRRLLDALTVMKLLQKDHGVYSLPDWAEYYLLPGKPTYFGNFILEWLAWEDHGQLAEVIRSGRRPIANDVTRAESVSHFIPFYAYRPLMPFHQIMRYDGYWQALRVEPREGMQAIDLACGAGIATLALAKLHSGVHVMLQDWPAMLEIALEVARKLGVEKQVTTLPGNLTSVELGEGKYDIARLGYVTYFFGPDDLVESFQRIHTALKPGGLLVIEADVSDEGHCEKEEAVLDGPWLYAVSIKGDVYSFTDYKHFLVQAGFQSIIQVRDDLIKAVR